MKDIYIKTVKGPWVTEPTTDTQYRIEETDDTVTILFQGSASNMDWKQNFMFWKKPYKRMDKIFFVHAGFLKKYKSVQEQILKVGRSAAAHGKKVVILTFSQGSGIGYLVVEDLKFNYPNIEIQTYFFGCPRTFTIFGSRVLKERLSCVQRVVNANDVVTRLPFVWMLYRHYGKEIHIGDKRRWWKLSIKDHTTYKENL